MGQKSHPHPPTRRLAISGKNQKHSKSTRSILEKSLPRALVSLPVLALQHRNQVGSQIQLHLSLRLSRMSMNCHQNLRISLPKNHPSHPCDQPQPRIPASLRFNSKKAKRLTFFTKVQWPKDCLKFQGTGTMSSIKANKTRLIVT